MNRTAAIARGREQGQLTPDSDRAAQDAYLMTDTDFRIEGLLFNVKEQFVELMGLALLSKYGPLSAVICERILSNSEEKTFLESAFDVGQAPNRGQDGTRIIGPTFEFIKYCFGSDFRANRDSILSANRPKAYRALRVCCRSSLHLRKRYSKFNFGAWGC